MVKRGTPLRSHVSYVNVGLFVLVMVAFAVLASLVVVVLIHG